MFDDNDEMYDHILENVAVRGRPNDVYQSIIVQPTPLQASTLRRMGCSQLELDTVRTVEDIDLLFDKFRSRPSEGQMRSLRLRGVSEERLRLVTTRQMASDLISRARSMVFASHRQMKLIHQLRRDADVTTEMPVDLREDEAHQYIQQLKGDRPRPTSRFACSRTWAFATMTSPRVTTKRSI